MRASVHSKITVSLGMYPKMNKRWNVRNQKGQIKVSALPSWFKFAMYFTLGIG